MKLFVSFLSLFLLPTLLMAGPDAAMQARVAAALASATLTKPATVKTAACYCDPECTCPCGPDCPCMNGCYVKTDHGVYKVNGTFAIKAGSCSCGPNCTCTAGECGSPNCPSLVRSNYPASPGPIEWALYLRQYNLALKENKPLLIWVGETCPSCEQQWNQYVHARLSEYDPTTGTPYYGPGVIVAKSDGLGGMTIAGKLGGIPSQSQVQAVITPAAQIATIPQQTFYYQPTFQPMMMGGFGGGFGGFCGGGGCSS